MTLSATPFGPALAADVADLLDRGGIVLAGWCAHWMRKADGRFVYERLKDAREEIFAAPDKAAFADWLAEQSPISLHAEVRPHCNDVIEAITAALLTQAVATDAGVLDRTPYGAALADQVADALDRGVALKYEHRDYCGMGLERGDGGYRYGPVMDGEIYGGEVFLSRADFVAWLAAQSDVSLSGRENAEPFVWDNQRITRARLLRAIAG